MGGGDEATRGGGVQMAQRSGGRTSIGPPRGDPGMPGRSSRGPVRRHWHFIPLPAAIQRGGGGALGKLWKYTMGSPGKGEGRGAIGVFVAIVQARMGPPPPPRGGLLQPCALRKTEAGSSPPWPRFTGDWPKAWGGGTSNSTFLPQVLREGARRGWDTLGSGGGGGGGMVALMCLSWFALLPVAEAASIRVADVQGEKALGLWATKQGIIGRRWRRWSVYLFRTELLNE